VTTRPKAQRVLKFKPTDFLLGLKETYCWYLHNNESPKAGSFLRGCAVSDSPDPAAAEGAGEPISVSARALDFCDPAVF
jgi:hypothetical protein